MHEIVVGTGNPAKKEAIQAAVALLGLRVRGADELGVSLAVQEDGKTAQDNARAKSVAYARVLRRPVLSVDNALYLDGLSPADQPGVNTRHVPGVEAHASDAQLLTHYARKVAQLGGRVNGYWEYALCIADPSGLTFEKTIRTPRTFVSEPSPRMIAGYPLESIQIVPESGRYVSEMASDEQAAFWQETIGLALCDFIREAQEHMPLGEPSHD